MEVCALIPVNKPVNYIEMSTGINFEGAKVGIVLFFN